MTMIPQKSAQTMMVYRSADLSVVSGANLGDALSFADELDLDDVYELRSGATPSAMLLRSDPEGHFVVEGGSEFGVTGARVFLDSALTMMSTDGQTLEVLLLVEVDGDGHAKEVFAMPLAKMRSRLGYALVGIDRDHARQRYAEAACVSFTKGTQITMASGEQRPVEELRAGDRLLTRDDGVRTLQWVGHTIARAVGDFAPIRIRAGALHNENDLLVSPDHRLFIYQRSDQLGTGRSEVLVRARHLVNGTTVTFEPGGFVEYFQLLFEQHHIIYAEGIAAETLLVDAHTRDALPQELLADQPAHDVRAHQGFEVDEQLLRNRDAASLLRNASVR